MREFRTPRRPRIRLRQRINRRRCDETHLSTFKPCAQTAPWFPCAYGDNSRPQAPERAPRAGSEIAERISVGSTSMTSPDKQTAVDRVRPSAAFDIEVLQQRPDFLRAARARKVVTSGFILQIRDRQDKATRVRVGFTCSKKVGNAVARNRAKRRLREVARLTLPSFAQAGHDYVLIGRACKTASLPFTQLSSDLQKALS